MLVVDNHRLVNVIAHGATSEIWSAVRLGPGGFAQMVALKTLSPHHARVPALVRAFLGEARAAARVHHPNVVLTHELIDIGGHYWLSMELIRGWTIRSVTATMRITRRPVRFDIAVAIVSAAARGVQAIHEAGLLHRHLTPDNLLVSCSGHSQVIDFGSSAWQLAEHVRFTPPFGDIEPAYASPQMLGRQRVDLRTDVYSLGALLYELVAGEPPPSPLGRQQSVIVAPSSWRADIPPALEAVIERALEGDPASRFASARELEQALEMVSLRHGWYATPTHVTAFLGEIFTGVSPPHPPPRGTTPPPPPPPREPPRSGPPAPPRAAPMRPLPPRSPARSANEPMAPAQPAARQSSPYDDGPTRLRLRRA